MAHSAFVLVLLFLMLCLGLTSGSTVVIAQNIVTEFAVSVACTSSGQLCTPLFRVVINTQDTLRANFLVSEGNCSSTRVHFLVDSSLVSTSEWLGYPGDPDGRPMETGVVDLGPVQAGTYEVAIQSEGQSGGCNSGELFGWGGTLLVITSESPAVAPNLWTSQLV